MKRKNKILILGGLLTSIGVYVIINKAIKKNLKKKIYEQLGGGTGKEEEKRINDIIARRRPATLSDAFNPNFFKTIAAVTGRGNITLIHMSPEQARKIAKDIHDSWGFWNDDEEKIYGALRSLATKLQVSFVAFWYNKQHESDLYETLNSELDDEQKAIAWGIVEKLPSI